MSQRRNHHRSLNKTRFFSDDSMGTRGNRAQRRFLQNQSEECPECGRKMKTKNLEHHMETDHAY